MSKSNATKHGLTSQFDPTSGRDWYRIILNDPHASMEFDQSISRREAAALSLAGAEVQRVKTERALRKFECQDDPLFAQRIELSKEVRTYVELIQNVDLDKRQKTMLKLMIGLWMKEFKSIEKAIAARQRLLKRYHREAASAHRKAFRQWCKFLKQTTIKARNEKQHI